jgi:hypothetical protein
MNISQAPSTFCHLVSQDNILQKLSNVLNKFKGTQHHTSSNIEVGIAITE